MDLARQAGFEGELHLSTLANVSFAAGPGPMDTTPLGCRRVVVPRELDIEEIKQMAAACPDRTGTGGFRSRRLVLRRVRALLLEQLYGREKRSAGPLRATLPAPLYPSAKTAERLFRLPGFESGRAGQGAGRTIPQVRAWKIEGRKKGPHYVYYTAHGLQMLRDQGQDPQVKKRRPWSCWSRPWAGPRPITIFCPSGLRTPSTPWRRRAPACWWARCKGPAQNPYIEPRQPLLAGGCAACGI